MSFSNFVPSLRIVGLLTFALFCFVVFASCVHCFPSIIFIFIWIFRVLLKKKRCAAFINNLYLGHTSVPWIWTHNSRPPTPTDIIYLLFFSRNLRHSIDINFEYEWCHSAQITIPGNMLFGRRENYSLWCHCPCFIKNSIKILFDFQPQQSSLIIVRFTWDSFFALFFKRKYDFRSEEKRTIFWMKSYRFIYLYIKNVSELIFQKFIFRTLDYH